METETWENFRELRITTETWGTSRTIVADERRCSTMTAGERFVMMKNNEDISKSFEDIFKLLLDIIKLFEYIL